MQFELLTLTGAKYHGEIAEVSLRTAAGQIGVLPHHEPLTSIVLAGPVIIRPRHGQAELFAIFGGLLEVNPDRVRLLADEAEHADELIESEIQAALTKARDLKAKAKDKHALQRAEELIDRQEVRLGVARLKRHHRSR
ncbi:MAG TPA: ATP synthase F1 subunit epsilon [Candidatus Saccharimonadia bacterium]|nr:ATP synthase F1 subunit epsilon [Candidatus Saccharimonadia bacterium]